MTMLAPAVAYTALGWRLVPLHTPLPDGGCSCSRASCASPGKHPRIPDWPRQASTNPATIAAWWSLWPDANVGLALGGGLIDIEADPRHGGDESLPLLEAKLGPLPDTVTWISGGDGAHRLYVVPPGVRIRNAASIGRDLLAVASDATTGVDVRGEGGLAVLPPSVHHSGALYRWGNLTPDALPIVELPSAWVDYLAQPSADATSPTDDGNPIPTGQRNATLARLAGAMRRVGMTATEIRTALVRANADRCRPPIDAAEVAAIAASVSRYSPDQVAVAVAEGHWQQDRAASRPPAAAASFVPSELLGYDTTDDPNCLIGRRWLCRGGSCLVVGQTGIGKSSFAAQAAVTWALGADLFGISPARPLRSLVIQAENDVGDLAEMLRGVVQGTGCHDRLNQLDQRLRFVCETACSGQAFLPYAHRLIQEHQPDLVWIDPLFAFLGGNVSDQEVVSAFLRNGLGAIAQQTGVAWMVVHHTNKPSKDPKGLPHSGDYAYLGSGSAELANWARAVLVLRQVSDELYELRAAKRGARAGLVDGVGQPATEVFLKHGERGICWERAQQPDDERRSDDQSLADEIVAGLESGRSYERREIRELVQEALGVSKSAVLTTGRRANRVYRAVLAVTDAALPR